MNFSDEGCDLLESLSEEEKRDKESQHSNIAALPMKRLGKHLLEMAQENESV